MLLALFLVSDLLLGNRSWPAVPQSTLTFSLAYSKTIPAKDYYRYKRVFSAALNRWHRLAPDEPQFQIVPAKGDYTVTFGPESIENGQAVGEMTYHVIGGRLSGIINLITDLGDYPRSTKAITNTELMAVSMHELGHVLGLDDAELDDEDCIMGNFRPDNLFTYPNAAEIAAVESVTPQKMIKSHS